jgi:hypothetical protein
VGTRSFLTYPGLQPFPHAVSLFSSGNVTAALMNRGSFCSGGVCIHRPAGPAKFGPVVKRDGLLWMIARGPVTQTSQLNKHKPKPVIA